MARVVRIPQINSSNTQPIVKVGRNPEVAANLAMGDRGECIAAVICHFEGCTVGGANGERLHGRHIVGPCAGLTLNLLSKFDEGFSSSHFLCSFPGRLPAELTGQRVFVRLAGTALTIWRTGLMGVLGRRARAPALRPEPWEKTHVAAANTPGFMRTLRRRSPVVG